MRPVPVMLALIGASTAVAATAEQSSTNPKCRIEVTQAAASAGSCGFNVARRRFAGSARTQAACLTRHVGQGGTIGAAELPPFLGRIVGAPSVPRLPRLARFLIAHGIDPEHELGGAMAPGLAAAYFVIHDTSSPNCSQQDARGCAAWGEPPLVRDTAQWPENASFGGYLANPASLKAHVITNRTGGSLTTHDLAEHVSHVRFDFCFDAAAKRNLFVGVENIQPRVGRPARPGPGEPVNDLIAPLPGFTSAQYERLALIYIAASARHGRWLIPAYHAVLDPLYDPPTAHDDPQNFDLAAFSAAVERLLTTIRRA